MNTRSIFITAIVYLSIVHVSTEDPYIGDCDIDNVLKGGPISLTFIDGIPGRLYFGRFSFPNLIKVCKTGNYVIKFVNVPAHLRMSKYNMHHLIASHSGMTANELRSLALPANLNRIDVSHNDIGYISYGMSEQI